MKSLRQILCALLCLTGLANAIPLPCDPLWNVRFADDDPTIGPSWLEGQNLCFAVGSNDTVHVISNGQVIRSSRSLGGDVTAITRADAWEDVEGNEFVVGIANDSLMSLLVLDNDQLTPVRKWALGENRVDRPIPDSLNIDGFTSHYTAIRTINQIGESSDQIFAFSYWSVDSYYYPRGGGSGFGWNGYICMFSMDEGRILDSSKCGAPPLIKLNNEQSESDLRIVTAGEDSFQNYGDMGHFGRDSCYLNRYDSNLSRVAIDTVEIEASVDGWGGAYFSDLEGVQTSVNGSVLFLAYTADFDFRTFKYQNYVAAYSADDLEFISRIEFDTTVVYSMTAVASSPNDENQDYLLCWTSYGIRVFNLNTWQLEDVVYTSPIGENDVQIKDFDGDGQWEVLGRNANSLSFGRLQPLHIASDQPETPKSHLLLSAFPNPFNSTTTISYTLPRSGHYSLTVSDITGREVVRLSEGWKEAGSYRENINAGQIPSGNYLLRLAGDEQISTKFLIIER